MTKLCIYHGACDDGFAAAWAVRAALGETVEFYPGVYQQPPPDVAGRDVIMVDFSYKRPVIDEMARAAKSILILDHHKTAAADLAGLPGPPEDGGDPRGWLPDSGVHAVFDMERSGAAMAWDHFYGEPRPAFINYIQDRDLWRRALPGVDDFTMALRSHPQDFAVWDWLAANGVEAMIAEGKAIGRYYRLRVEEFKRAAYPANLGGHRVRIANAPYFAASEVAGELAAGDDVAFGACYFEVGSGRYQYSLRSRGAFDVSAVALQFGGGGHRGAAGFTTVGTVHRRRIEFPMAIDMTPISEQ